MRERSLTACPEDYNHALTKDWSYGANKITSAVKNCGNCLAGHWAFAVVQQLESDAKQHDGVDYLLSPEQLLQCVTSNNGCSVPPVLGAAEYAFTYLKTTGAHSNNNYPYTSSGGSTGGPCIVNPSREEVRVANFYTNLQGNENCMTKYVQYTGTVTNCFTVSENAWIYYTGGIMTASQCNSGGTMRIACAQIVGVRIETSGTNYWKVRGSFSTSWGEQGFIRLSHGSNTCSITQDPIYTSVLVQGEF